MNIETNRAILKLLQVKKCRQRIADVSAELRIAFIGQPGAGKSSTLSTIGSFACWPPTLKQVARAGKGDANITKERNQHALEAWHEGRGQNRKSSVIMHDTPGQATKVWLSSLLCRQSGRLPAWVSSIGLHACVRHTCQASARKWGCVLSYTLAAAVSTKV